MVQKLRPAVSLTHIYTLPRKEPPTSAMFVHAGGVLVLYLNLHDSLSDAFSQIAMALLPTSHSSTTISVPAKLIDNHMVGDVRGSLCENGRKSHS